jgi:hypothetical protein
MLVFGGAVLPALAVGGSFVSCGGDDNGGPSVAMDSGADGTMNTDATADASADGDAAKPDSGQDATVDAADGASLVDAGSDAADASIDTGIDAGSILDFPGKVATALCERTAVCCGFSGLDASGFNSGKCFNDFVGTGFKGSSLGAELLDAGNITFNPSKAQSCLAQIAAIDCTTNQLTSAVDTALYADCFAALVGTLQVGSSCAGSIQCAPGEFCDPVEAGADASFCQPLRTANQPCSDFYPNPDSGVFPTGTQIVNAQTACSYRGSGDTNLACAYLDPKTFQYLYPAVCVPAGPLDAGCISDQACTSKACSVPACVTAERFIFPATCTGDTIPDAGGPG